LKRLSITLTEEANKVYGSWKSHERSKKVSEAIVRYESAQDIDIRLEQIEARLLKIEKGERKE
jgi:hypothetical protein